MESIQVKLENLGTWLSDIFFSFQLTFSQGIQRNNLTVQRAVNSREGNGLGKQYGKGMKGAWGDSQISRRLLFTDTIEGTGSKRCVDACHLLPPFPPLDGTSTAETAAHHDKVIKLSTLPWCPLSPWAVALLSELDQAGYWWCFLQSCSYQIQALLAAWNSNFFLLSHLHMACSISSQNS